MALANPVPNDGNIASLILELASETARNWRRLTFASNKVSILHRSQVRGGRIRISQNSLIVGVLQRRGDFKKMPELLKIRLDPSGQNDIIVYSLKQSSIMK